MLDTQCNVVMYMNTGDTYITCAVPEWFKEHDAHRARQETRQRLKVSYEDY